MPSTADFQPTLVVITGPTASGKSALALQIAEHYGADILSADSRQIFRGISIGTAAPNGDDLRRVTHHFVMTLNLDEYYSAAQFETDALALLKRLFVKNPIQVVCGGSMMYIDALCYGIDELPTISAETRRRTAVLYSDGGIEAIRATLLSLDPDYYRQVDLNNHKRIIHAIEISLEAGQPYSSLRTGQRRQRPFRIMRFAINHSREELFTRINRRVDRMIADGLVEEARQVFHLRHLNSLNTVGYKELFRHFDGEWDLDTAVERIKKNTRVFAKKQLTWLKRDSSVVWLSPSDNILKIIDDLLYNPG